MKPLFSLHESETVIFFSLKFEWIHIFILQAHGLSVCHGDIKLENLMITSWSWVLLTDFASFKPIFLPEDNPADFSYFFDTSRRRACYIAPERFKTRTLSLDTNTSLWSSTANLGTQSGVSLFIVILPFQNFSLSYLL
jgi:serine/threonine protein kinase